MDQAISPPVQRSRTVAVLITALLASFLVGFGIQAASAGIATSATGYWTVNGIQYKNNAVIITGTGNANARTYTGPTSVSVSSGWVSSRGRLFTSGGALSCEGSNTYNSGTLAAGATVYGSSCTRLTSGAWYSYGVSQAWNGGGYSPFYTFQSPNQNS